MSSVNVTNGVKEDRLMMTGMHTVSDIFCVGCGSIVGWKYVAAHEKTQRYKEGKFILERYKVSGPDGSSYWATHDAAHLVGSDADDCFCRSSSPQFFRSEEPHSMESVTAAPIPEAEAPEVSVDGGAAAAVTEENAAAAADAVAETMAEHLTIGTDNASTGGPVDLGAEGGVYSCKDCSTHLGLASDIVSKAFHCKHGKAYLFHKVVNVTVGVKEDRLMVTGLHTISDIFCGGCGVIVGWKYEAAHERSQKYKEGKYILERYMLLGPDGSQYSPAHDAIALAEPHQGQPGPWPPLGAGKSLKTKR
ncbi:hypothetical protein EJB05_05045 [Eragrostis curvula]|uniref:Yippee domain-containing protein n=1 Tax=Eragrostis curvula TaxID=38414 RepID=A0A5J9WC47_9POAL|nr:hypothetical protein EJB05_05045 [Eragrostis curvula]